MNLPNKIIQQDCIDGMKTIPDNSVSTIIADPPYNIGKDFGNDSDKQDMDDYLKWSKEWIEESYRILKDGGSMFVYGFSEILAHIFVNIPYNKKWLVWHYTNKTVPSLKDWQRSHESIIHIWKGDKKIFNVDDVREPYTKQFLKNAAGKVRKSTPGRFGNGDKETVYTANPNGALPKDVLKVSALAGGAGASERWFYCQDCEDSFHPKEKKNHDNHNIFKHPTQKPYELTKKLLLSSLPKNLKNDVVVVFAGSGAELVVAKELGCNFVGFELNPDYVKLGNCWLEKVEVNNK
jgi:site-specific DNA-methyltransferase (adenine-specific)